MIIGIGTVEGDLVVDDDTGPWADYNKIQDAVNVSSEGELIRVYSGTYYEAVNVNQSVIIIGNGSGDTVVDSDDGICFRPRVDDIFISDFKTIASLGSYGFGFVDLTNITIEDCVSTGGHSGFYVSSSYEVEIQRCVVYGTSQYGMYLFGFGINATDCEAYNTKTGFRTHSTTAILLRCVAWNCDDYGFYQGAGSMIDCESYGNDYGVYLNMGMENCTIHHNSELGVEFNKGEIRNSSIYENNYGIEFKGSGSIYSTTVNDTRWLGVKIESQDDIEIRNSNFYSNWKGIYCVYSENVEINGCSFWDHDTGIQLTNSDKCRVRDSLFYNNGYGISAGGVTDTVIRNCTAYNCTTGFYTASNENGLEIRLSTAHNCTTAGIYIWQGKGTKVLNCNVYDNWAGIWADWTSGNKISNCVGINNRISIYLQDSDRSECIDNVVKDSRSGIAVWSTTYAKLTNNKLTNASLSVGGGSLKEWNTHYIPISNKIDKVPIRYYKNQTKPDVNKNAKQIIIANCDDVKINRIEGLYSISIGYTSGVHMSRLGLSHHVNRGIKIYESSDVKIENSTITNSSYGIEIDNSDEIYIGWCTFNNTMTGIDDYKTSNGEISRCRFTNSSYYGINLFSSEMAVHDSTFQNNSDYGIRIVGSEANCSVWSNNFIDNANGSISQCYITTGECTWDNGTHGNYWSDYNGTDANQDGIGDEPYEIETDQEDSRPLMEPYLPKLKRKTEWIVDDDNGWWADFATIQDAVDNSMDGDRIKIFEGIYRECIEVNRSIIIEGNGTSRTIMNGSGLDADVVLIEANGIRIMNLSVEGAVDHDGISTSVLRYLDNIVIEGCKVGWNHRGIVLERGMNHSVRNSTITRNDIGLTLNNNTRSNVTACTISENSVLGLSMHYSEFISIEGCDLYYDGISIFGLGSPDISYWDTNEIIDCTNNGDPIVLLKNQTGVLLDDSYGGLLLVNCSDIEISEAQISAGDIGIQIIHSTGLVIDDIVIEDHGFEGIRASYSDDITISNCIVQRCSDIGINLGTDDSTIFNNNLSDNGLTRLSQNGGYGIVVNGDHNLIHSNDFINNGVDHQALDNSSTTQWDNGTHGNYWGDYDGSDSDLNGIGDTPYEVHGDGDREDRYPIVHVPPKPDNIIPECVVTNPADEEEVHGIINITGTSSDDDGSVSKVEVRIDSGTWQEANGTNSWSLSWNSTVAGEGEYRIEARAFDGENHSLISMINITVVDPEEPGPIETVPSQPVSVRADPDEDGITLEWDEPDDDGNSSVIGYKIYRRSGNGAWVLVHTVVGDDTAFIDDEAEPDIEYSYRVTAVNDVGEGDPSEEVNALIASIDDVDEEGGSGDDKGGLLDLLMGPAGLGLMVVIIALVLILFMKGRKKKSEPMMTEPFIEQEPEPIVLIDVQNEQGDQYQNQIQ